VDYSDKELSVIVMELDQRDAEISGSSMRRRRRMVDVIL